jgi:hypothetical protein
MSRTDFSSALSTFDLAKMILVGLFGPTHSKVGDVEFARGHCFLMQNAATEAVDAFKRTLAVYSMNSRSMSTVKVSLLCSFFWL